MATMSGNRGRYMAAHRARWISLMMPPAGRGWGQQGQRPLPRSSTRHALHPTRECAWLTDASRVWANLAAPRPPP